MQPLSLLRVFVDADIYYAAAVSDRGASRVVLTLGQFGLLSLETSQLAVDEARRNLAENAPEAVESFDKLLSTRSWYLFQPRGISSSC